MPWTAGEGSDDTRASAGAVSFARRLQRRPWWDPTYVGAQVKDGVCGQRVCKGQQSVVVIGDSEVENGLRKREQI